MHIYIYIEDRGWSDQVRRGLAGEAASGPRWAIVRRKDCQTNVYWLIKPANDSVT